MPTPRAVAAPPDAVAAADGETATTTFALPKNASITVEVTRAGDAQRIRCVTDLEAGRLLLHWGLEGGKGYKGGWRLAGEAARPEGTRQYKDRALQSPFKPAPDGRSEVSITLSGDEASDALYFVLKDDATNTWCVCVCDVGCFFERLTDATHNTTT
jgi:alpha-glucan,water dikinase